jgi:hypothetical protein
MDRGVPYAEVLIIADPSGGYASVERAATDKEDQ